MTEHFKEKSQPIDPAFDLSLVDLSHPDPVLIEALRLSHVYQQNYGDLFIHATKNVLAAKYEKDIASGSK